MRNNINFGIGLVFVLGMVLSTGCNHSTQATTKIESNKVHLSETKKKIIKESACNHFIEKEITAGEYFDFIDDLVAHYDSILEYPITEHLIMRNNHWLIDTLINTDYYLLMEKGNFVYDPQSIVVLKPGDSLRIPTEREAEILTHQMAKTLIDVNIPEYKLSILEAGSPIYETTVRVGRNTKRYLAMAGRDVDLKTRPGYGEIVRIARDPAFINPRNNKRYSVTKRDDGKTTKMPRIPWIEPEINGTRYGQLIHPTTNLKTLGKAYSNGCVGTSEADAWRLYFYAPVGTKVQFRYDLEIETAQGETKELKDIYPGYSKRWERIKKRQKSAS